MSDVNILIELAQKVGIPALFALVLLGLGVRYIPKILDAWLTAKTDQQRAGDERRRAAEEQADKIIEVAARTELALQQSSGVIAHNTEVNERVAATFGVMLNAIDELAKSIHEHDKRAEEMNIGIHQILENARR
ncbi:MAG: hypothetical protein LBT12_04985 [Oscillospiraceae bacterium]|jgi:hypothetical protein|nr:hypothetical protein [Oscillospiraceae bacterium]